MYVPYNWTPSVGLDDRAKRDRVPYDLFVKQGHMFTTPGATVDYGFVAQMIGEVASELKILHSIAFDRNEMVLVIDCPVCKHTLSVNQ